MTKVLDTNWLRAVQLFHQLISKQTKWWKDMSKNGSDCCRRDKAKIVVEIGRRAPKVCFKEKI